MEMAIFFSAIIIGLALIAEGKCSKQSGACVEIFRSRKCNPVCAEIYEPVCDSEGKTHSNKCVFEYEECIAAQKGCIITIAHLGKCPEPDCHKCRAEAVALCFTHPDTFIPECWPDNTFAPTQYDKDQSFCVDKFGNEYEGTRYDGDSSICDRSPDEGKPAPACSKKLKDRMLTKGFKPSCNKEGMFEPVQCYEKRCWCVFANGQLIPNTMHEEGAAPKSGWSCAEYQAIAPTCATEGFEMFPADCSRYFTCAPDRHYHCYCGEGPAGERLFFDFEKERCDYEKNIICA